MKYVFAIAALFVASVATAGPIVSVTPDAFLGEDLGNGNVKFVFNLDPDGETDYTAVEVSIVPTIGEFLSPQGGGNIFALPSDNSGFYGTGTVTNGYTVLSPTASSDLVGATLTSFGGPATSSFSGDLAQVVGAAGLAGTATFSFADAGGNVVGSQEVLFGIPEPTTALIAGLGVIGFAARRHS